MKKFIFGLILSAGLLSLFGCGPHYYRAALGPDQPAEITVSAYTQQGCFDELQEEARARNVEVKLKEVNTELGWEILVFPFYKGYRCTGVVIEPKK